MKGLVEAGKSNAREARSQAARWCAHLGFSPGKRARIAAAVGRLADSLDAAAVEEGITLREASRGGRRGLEVGVAFTCLGAGGARACPPPEFDAEMDDLVWIVSPDGRRRLCARRWL